jgi:hypothetical protein
MSVGFQIKGLVEMNDGLKRMKTQMLDTVGKELTNGLMRVEAKAKPLTPVSPGGGLLRASTYVSPVQITNGQVSVSIFNNQEYAGYVHERQDPYMSTETVKFGYGGVRMRMPVMKRVKWTIAGTGPKFIERPLTAEIPNIEERVTKAVEDLAKGGV